MLRFFLLLSLLAAASATGLCAQGRADLSVSVAVGRPLHLDFPPPAVSVVEKEGLLDVRAVAAGAASPGLVHSVLLEEPGPGREEPAKGGIGSGAAGWEARLGGPGRRGSLKVPLPDGSAIREGNVRVVHVVAVTA